MALVIGSRALEQYKGTPIASKLESVLEKLAETLPEEISLNPTELYSNFSFSAPPAIPVKPRIWETVVKGLLSKRKIEISYNGKTLSISPMHMANLQGAWYLFVRFYDYDNFRQISIGRIEKARLLKETFDPTGFAKGDIEVKRWILAWGCYCKVKSPQWVKQMIDDEVAAMGSSA